MPSERTLLERNQGILSRIRNLKVLEPKLRDIFIRGKREHLLQGMSAEGLRFAPLKPSTLRQRRGGGPPLSPQFGSSEIIVAYRVDITFAENSVTVTGGWPMDWVHYHVTGTSHMARRDPGGFREQDKREALRVTREYIFNGAQ